MGLSCVYFLPRIAPHSPQGESKDGEDVPPATPVKPTATAAPARQSSLCSLLLTRTGFFIVASLLDVCGMVSIVVSIRFAGSGLFQVVYASVVCWAALFSKFGLGTRISMVSAVGGGTWPPS